MTDQWKPSPTDGMTPVFNYDEVTPEGKRVAEEIISLLEQKGDHITAEMLKVKFNIVEPPTYDIEKSPFTEVAVEAGLFVNVQGTVVDDGVHYQIVSICDDIRNLEKIIPVIAKKIDENLEKK